MAEPLQHHGSASTNALTRWRPQPDGAVPSTHLCWLRRLLVGSNVPSTLQDVAEGEMIPSLLSTAIISEFPLGSCKGQALFSAILEAEGCYATMVLLSP
eukprot:scaffold96276_cov28-Tisochrysis_lutea.AAC.2